MIKESSVSLQVEHSGGLRLQEQLARLVTQSAKTQVSPMLRFSQAQASTGFVSAPNEFLPGLLDSIRLSVSGAGVQTMSMTFSGDTSSARISLGLGTTPTIRLEYLDTAGDIIKVGSRSVSVSLSMPPVVLEPVPGPLPELIVSHQSGYFVSPMQVDFSASGTDIVYTTDATDPKSSSSAQRVSDFLSLPVSESVTVLAFVEKDGQKSGTRRYVYNKETIPEIEPVIGNPERFLNGFFDTELRVLFPAIPDRPLVKLWLNGEEKNLPFAVTLTELVTAEYKAISERGFSNTTPIQMELTRVSVYHDLLHTIHSPSVENLFAGTASVEFLSPETGYRFMYTTDETVPVTGALEVPLPFTLDIDRTTVMLGYLIHPSGLKSDLIQKRFSQAPLPDPDNIIRDFSVMEDQELSVDLLSLGVDPDLDIYVDINPLFGTLSINGHEITYTPDPDYFGVDAFSLEFLHQSGLFLQLGFLVEVQGVNDAPQVFGNFNPITNEDEAIELDFLVFDPDFDPIDIQISRQPSHGTLFNTTDGLLFYEPFLDYFGEDTFSLVASDQTTEIEFDFVVTVLPVNDAPILIVEPLSVMEDASLTTRVFGYDVEGDLLSYALDSQPANGTASISTDGELVYVPNPDYHGFDSIIVKVSDGELEFTTDILVTVYPTNDAPEILLFSDSAYSNLVNSLVLSEDTTGFLYFNLVDMDGDFPEISLPILLSESMTTSIEYDLGTSSGLIRIEPIADFHGNIDLSLTACDLSALPPEPFCTSTTVVLTYLPVNDAPQFLEVYSLNALEDSDVSTSVYAYDVDGDLLTYSILSQPASGIATITGETVTYTPNPDYFGSDSFMVRAVDPSGASTDTEISVLVEGVDDAPKILLFSDAFVTAFPENFQVDEDEEVVIHFEILDLDGHMASLSLTPVANTTSVFISVISSDDWITGQIVIAPDMNFNGAVSISVLACDSSTSVTNHLCSSEVIEIEFLPVNDAPQFLEVYSLNALEDLFVSTSVYAYDVDGDLLTYSILSQPASGIATITGETVTYTPNPDYFGSDSFMVRAVDPSGASTDTEISVLVEGVDDAPQILLFSDAFVTAFPENFQVDEDEEVVIHFEILDLDGHMASLSLTPVADTTSVLISVVSSDDWITGQIVIAPDMNFNGPVSISVLACDSSTSVTNHLCSSEVIEIEFLPVNDAPELIAPFVLSGLEDSVLTTQLQYFDPEFDSVEFSITTEPIFGIASVTTSGVLTYIPNPDYFGMDIIGISVTDTWGSTGFSQIDITIDPVNDAPEIVLFMDSMLTQPFIAQEFIEDSVGMLYYSLSDLESDPISISSTEVVTGLIEFEVYATDVTTGYLVLNPYTDWYGMGQISISVCDTTTIFPGSLCTTSVVDLNFLPVNDAPTLSLFSDSGFTFATSVVSLLEDSTTAFYFTTWDSEMDAVTVTYVADAGAAGSFMVIDSALWFTPSTNWYGVQTAALEICDITTIPPGSLCSLEPLTFMVDPVNDAPEGLFFSDGARLVATSGFELLEDESLTIYFSAIDVEGDLVSVTLLNSLTSGSISIDTTASSLTLSTSANFFGTDVAVLEFCDIAPATPPSLCSTYSLPILIHPVNDAPIITIISALPVTGDEDNDVSFTFSVSDIELSPLSISLSSAPTKGTVTFPVNASGTGTYTPYPNENGADSFELSVSDSELTSQAVFTVQITPTPDAPEITWPDIASAIFVNVPYPLNPVVIDPDLPADTLSYSWTMTTSPFVGAGEINNPTSTEAFLFVTYPGSYQVELTVTDSFSLSDIETFNFVTKDDWIPTAANIGLPTTPVLITGSSFGKNLYFGWIGDDSRAEVRIQTASGWGTLSGTMATTIPAMVVRNHENQVYVAYRDASSNNNISVMHSPLMTWGLRRVGQQGMAVLTSNAFDMAVTRRGTPIVCYAKSQALAKPGCVYYDTYWHPMSEVSALPNFPNIILLKMVLNLDEQPIVIHYDGSAVRAHVWNNTAWASHGTVFTDSNVVQIEASYNGLQTYVLVRLNNGTTKVFVHTGSTTLASLVDPDLTDSANVSLLADGRGPVHIASVQNDGTARVIRFTGSGWENSMVSPAGTFGPAMSILRKVGQPVLAHHQLNSVEPAVVRTLNSRMPMIVNATPALSATKVETGMNLSLEWNRPLMTGSGNFVGVTNRATPATTLAASTSYSETAGFVTTVNPSSNLAPDSTVLLKVATGISDMQGFGVPTDMFVPFTTRRTTALIADADFTASEYPGSKDDYSIAIKPSGVGVDAKWVAWNRISNQNLVTKSHTTGSSWLPADSPTGFGPSFSSYPQIAFFKDVPWIVAKDSTGMYAMSYDGTNWVTSATNIAGASVHQIVHKVGPRINAAVPNQFALTLKGGTYALQMYKRTHPSTTWTLVGGNIYDDISNHYDFTVLPNGNPVVAFVTQSAPDQVRVSMFNGSIWVAVTPNYPFIPGHDYTNIRIQNWGNHLHLAAIHNISGTKSLLYNSYDMGAGGDWWTTSHQTNQSGIDNFDMAIVDSVPYIFAVKSSPLYTPLLIRGGLPNTWEFSSNLLAGTGISNVADGKLAAHRGRLYLIYRDSSTFNLNGWFLEP